MGTEVSPAPASAAPVKKVRYEWLDVLRAAAILFVILGHQAANGIYSVASVTSHVKLAIFFAVSGFLFSKSKIDKPKEFFKNKLFRLLLPYIYLCSISKLIPGAVNAIRGKAVFTDVLITHAKQLLHGDILWFIPNLFIAEIVMFAVLKIVKKNDKALIILSIVSLIAGYFAKTPGTILPFRINTVLVTWPLLVFGYLIRDYINVLDKKYKLIIGSVSAAVYCAGPVLARIIRGQWIIMNINDSIYDSYVFNILLALAGTLAAFMLVQFIPFPRFVKALGRNTLFYYAFHNQACSAVTYALSLISGFTINRQFLACDRWLWLAIVAVALILMALPCWVVNKCAPFLVGKKMSETGCIWLKTGKKKS